MTRIENAFCTCPCDDWLHACPVCFPCILCSSLCTAICTVANDVYVATTGNERFSWEVTFTLICMKTTHRDELAQICAWCSAETVLMKRSQNYAYTTISIHTLSYYLSLSFKYFVHSWTNPRQDNVSVAEEFKIFIAETSKISSVYNPNCDRLSNAIIAHCIAYKIMNVWTKENYIWENCILTCHLLDNLQWSTAEFGCSPVFSLMRLSVTTTVQIWRSPSVLSSI